jgi:hypothetical protein
VRRRQRSRRREADKKESAGRHSLIYINGTGKPETLGSDFVSRICRNHRRLSEVVPSCIHRQSKMPSEFTRLRSAWLGYFHCYC